MKFNLLFKSVIVCAIIVIIASCDRDYNEIGTNIIGDDHYGLKQDSSEVIAYNQNVGAVQTNNLPINSLGFYNNSIFGNTTASFVTQVQLASPDPKFYIPTIDSVYIYIPFYSKILTTDATTGNTYQLDSILGNNKIKLSVYRSGYDIQGDSDNPDYVNPTKYYNDQQPDVDAVKGQLLYSNDTLSFDKTQRKFYKPDGITVSKRLAPGIFMNLSPAMVDYFKQNIIQTSSSNLFNNNAFKQYFKGLYFKAEASPGLTQGSLARMNFSQGKIVIVYRDYNANPSTVGATITRMEMTLNMTGNTINLLNNDFVNPITASPTFGDNRLYLKGGDGSMAVLSLFGGSSNKDSWELNKMRDQKWLINDASLTFFIDKNTMGTINEPNRIYLYDLTNKRPIIDYYNDASTSTSSKYAKSIFGGIILDDNNKVVTYNTTARGTKYKIRITNYLRNLVKNGNIKDASGNNTTSKDTTNVKLGLVVTENIVNPLNAYLKTPFPYNMNDNDGVLKTLSSKYVPVMSVVNPLGTVLYGSNIPPTDPNYKKRIKLNIWYTKPD